MTLKDQMDLHEEEIIIECFLRKNGNITNTCKELKVSRTTMTERVYTYGLKDKYGKTELFRRLMGERKDAKESNNAEQGQVKRENYPPRDCGKVRI